MKILVKGFVGILFMLVAFSSCNEKKQNNQNLNQETWRESELFTNERLSSLFPDSLKTVHSSISKKQADTLLQKELLALEAMLPPDTVELLLNLYAQSFPENKKSRAFVSEEKAVLNLRQSKLDSSYWFAKQSLQDYTELKDTGGMARSHMIIASSFGFQGDFSNAQKNQIKAIELYELTHNESGKNNAMTEMCINFYLEGRYKEAEKLGEQILKYAIAAQDTFLHADILNTIGSIYHQLGKQKESTEAILESIEIRKQLNDDFGLSEAYNGLAVTLMSQAKWKEAIELIEKSKEISNRIGDLRNFTSINYNLGTCYLELGKNAQAENIFLQVLAKANKDGIKDESIMRTLQKISELYKREGDMSNAYFYSNQLVELKSELFTEEKARITSELTTKYKLAESVSSLKISEEEKVSLQEKRIIMVFLLVIVSLFAAILTFLLIQRNKNSKRLHLAEQKLKDEAVEKIQRELKYNREQLNDFTNHLVEKNKIIFELEKKLLNFSESSSLRKKDEDEDDPEEYTSLLQLRILTDDDWSKFKMYFDKVFPGLILQLRQEHPNVTGAEERLFLLLKLKTDSREMAEILGISMESVRKNKYRLKKKLQLGENHNLEEYISSF